MNFVVDNPEGLGHGPQKKKVLVWFIYNSFYYMLGAPYSETQNGSEGVSRLHTATRKGGEASGEDLHWRKFQRMVGSEQRDISAGCAPILLASNLDHFPSQSPTRRTSHKLSFAPFAAVIKCAHSL